jgi:hypothetical protein
MRRRREASLGRAHTPSQKHAESTSATPNQAEKVTVTYSSFPAAKASAAARQPIEPPSTAPSRNQANQGTAQSRPFRKSRHATSAAAISARISAYSRNV